MREVSLAKVKSSLSEFASRAAYPGEHIIITKRGRPFAAIISIEDLLLMGGLDVPAYVARQFGISTGEAGWIMAIPHFLARAPL